MLLVCGTNGFFVPGMLLGPGTKGAFAGMLLGPGTKGAFAGMLLGPGHKAYLLVCYWV